VRKKSETFAPTPKRLLKSLAISIRSGAEILPDLTPADAPFGAGYSLMIKSYHIEFSGGCQGKSR